MAGHTGQSSQLFADANHRNAQFLTTAARGALVEAAIAPQAETFSGLSYYRRIRSRIPNLLYFDNHRK